MSDTRIDWRLDLLAPLIGAAAVTQSPDFRRNAPLPIVLTMTQNVSVPEKTLEHWASLCVAYRYQSLAAQWWPVNGWISTSRRCRPSPARPYSWS